MSAASLAPSYDDLGKKNELKEKGKRDGGLGGHSRGGKKVELVRLLSSSRGKDEELPHSVNGGGQALGSDLVNENEAI